MNSKPKIARVKMAERKKPKMERKKPKYEIVSQEAIKQIYKSEAKIPIELLKKMKQKERKKQMPQSVRVSQTAIKMTIKLLSDMMKKFGAETMNFLETAKKKQATPDMLHHVLENGNFPSCCAEACLNATGKGRIAKSSAKNMFGKGINLKRGAFGLRGESLNCLRAVADSYVKFLAQNCNKYMAYDKSITIKAKYLKDASKC